MGNVFSAFGRAAVVIYFVLATSSALAYTPRVYYGARFEPVDKVLHGAGQTVTALMPRNVAFELYGQVMGPGRYPTVFMDYCQYTSRDFTALKSRLQTIEHRTGRYVVPQIGLRIPSDPAITPQDNATAIYHLCMGLKDIGRPIFLRIGYEFNGTWHTPMYQPGSYISWFRAVTIKLRELDVPVATLWCAYPGWGDPTYESWDYIRQFYPGDEYVDWWCFDTFSPQDITHPETEKFLDNAELHHKPVMIGEATPRGVGADDAADWDAWFAPFFNLINTRPGIKGHTYINRNWANTPWPTWGDARLETGDPSVRLRYWSEMGSDLYYHAGEEIPDFFYLHPPLPSLSR